MKKLISSLTLCLSTFAFASVNAQSFFEPTDYVGALSSDASKDWTAGWTTFDPKNAAYGAPTDLTTLDATTSDAGHKHITGNVTIGGVGVVYLLKGIITVDSLASLTIKAGTIIRGSGDKAGGNYAFLNIHRGGKIYVWGTKDSPVVMTSAKDAGARDRADWGGLFIAGAGTHNGGSNVRMEGFDKVTLANFNEGYFGGGVADDNSGVLRYLRVEFAGIDLDVNKEINSVTFGAVGSGTTVDYVQSSYSNDDSFEWFGGLVNCKHLIAFSGTDDDFDTDNGFSGLVQFGIGIRNKRYYDATYNAISGASTSEGFESDNDANGTQASPYTSAIFSNMTMIGPVPVGSTWNDLATDEKAAFRRGARIRRNSKQSIINSVFMGYRNFLMIDGALSLTNAGLNLAGSPLYNESLQFKNNVIVNTSASFVVSATGTANGLVEVAAAADLANLDAWVRNAANGNRIDPVAFTTGTLLTNPIYAASSSDFKPVAASPALTGADFTLAKFSGNVNTVVGFSVPAASITASPNSISNLSTTSVSLTVSAENLTSSTITISIPSTATGFALSNSLTGSYLQEWTLTGVARTITGPASIGGVVVSSTPVMVYDLSATELFAQYTATSTSSIVTYVTIASGSTSAIVALSNQAAPTVPSGIISSLEDNGVSIYPNPTEDGSVTVKVNADEVATVAIFSTTGVKVAESKVYTSVGSTSFSGLAAGLYVVKISSGTSVVTEKLVVR